MAKVNHPTLKMCTGPEWLIPLFDGHTNTIGTAAIHITRDANGLPIVNTDVLSDPNWNFNIPVTNPNTQETKPLKDWLTEIPYCYESNL